MKNYFKPDPEPLDYEEEPAVVEEKPIEKYVAVKGINHDGLDLRVEPEEQLPDELVSKTKAIRMWLKDGAIKKVGE